MRKEIKAECEFLQKWGSTFNQANQDHPGRDDLKWYRLACVDAYFALRGEAMQFHTDETILSNLLAIKQYIEKRNTEGAFKSPVVFLNTIKMLNGIIQMLSITQPASNTEGVQKSLF